MDLGLGMPDLVEGLHLAGHLGPDPPGEFPTRPGEAAVRGVLTGLIACRNSLSADR